MNVTTLTNRLRNTDSKTTDVDTESPESDDDDQTIKMMTSQGQQDLQLGETRTKRWKHRPSADPNHVVRRTKVLMKNKFDEIAPIWFYGLIGQFMKTIESNMWSDEMGAILLSNFFITLTSIVENSSSSSSNDDGNNRIKYYRNQNTPILVKDLIQLVWKFRDADLPEVRASVLYTIGISIDILTDHDAINLLFSSINNDGQNENNIAKTIQYMTSNDPDENCRVLSNVISNKIVIHFRSIKNSLITVL